MARRALLVGTTTAIAAIHTVVPLIKHALALDQLSLLTLHAHFPITKLRVLQPSCQQLCHNVVRISDHRGPEVLVEIFGHMLLLFSGEVDLPIPPVLIGIALVVCIVQVCCSNDSAGLGSRRNIAELVVFARAFRTSIEFFIAATEDQIKRFLSFMCRAN